MPGRYVDEREHPVLAARGEPHVDVSREACGIAIPTEQVGYTLGPGKAAVNRRPMKARDRRGDAPAPSGPGLRAPQPAGASSPWDAARITDSSSPTSMFAAGASRTTALA